MINSVTITNHLGESVTMELRFPEKSGFLIRDIDGLDPSKADIAIDPISTGDGSVFNNARVQSRTLTFSLSFVGSLSVEEMRRLAYKYFPLKKQIVVLVETDSRMAITSGYVESNNVTIFSKDQVATIVVICPDPWFYAPYSEETAFNTVDAAFQFPFSNESLVTKLLIMGTTSTVPTKSIYYSGDVAVGVTMFIHVIGPVVDPEISNPLTGEKMKIVSSRLGSLGLSGLDEGDDLIISTVKGLKFIYLVRGGLVYNVLNALDKYPYWFQVERGDNILQYTAAEGASNLQFRVSTQLAYEGV